MRIGKIVEDVTDTVKSFSTKEQTSSRHEVDMMADNQLSKNARPIAMLWMLALLTLGIVLACFKVDIPDTFQETVFWGVSISLGFYFGGRTLEKSKKTIAKIERRQRKQKRN